MRAERHEWSGGWFTVSQAMPHPQLQGAVIGPYVEWCERAHAPTVRREVAGTVVPFIINFDAPYRLVASVHAPVTHASFTAGVYDSWVDVHGATSAHAVQANLTPMTARAVLALPLDLLANRAISLEEALGATGRRLVEALGNARDLAARARLLDEFLMARLAAAPRLPQAVHWSWAQLVRHHGQVPIAELQAATGWSATRLGAAVREACGHTPRRLGSILRFEQAVREARAQRARGQRLAWSRIAATCGYADHAHLTREFRRFAGQTPSAWSAHLPAEMAARRD